VKLPLHRHDARRGVASPRWWTGRAARSAIAAGYVAALLTPLDRATIHAAAQVAVPATVTVAQTVATATVTPSLGLSLGNDHATAIPGDVIRYTATITNNGATIALNGDITATNTSAAVATVASYFDGVDYQLQGNESVPGEAGDLVLNSGSWISLAGYGAASTGYTPFVPAPSTGAMTLSLTPVQSAGVSYPTTGDAALGTVIQANATATWHYSASVPMTAAMTRTIMDTTQLDSLRAHVHVEVTPSTQQLAQQSSAQTFFTERVFGEDPDGGVDDVLDGITPEVETAGTDSDDAPVQSATLTATSITFTPPAGPAQTDSDLPPLAPGASATWNPAYIVPPAAAKGAGETDAAYLARLQSLEASALSASATAQGTVPAGTVHATAPAVTTTEHLPVLHLAKGGPTTVLAGTGATFPLVVSNTGGADATALTTADNVANGGTGAIADTPATVAAGVSMTAHATYTVPLLQSVGSLADTAPLTWRDANFNLYGPISSTYTTTITSPLSDATLTLTPFSSGPDVTGTTQTLRATLLTSGGSPIANAPVHFAVTGVDTVSSNTTTDATGVAVFTYSGTADGVDSVVATLNAGWTTLVSNTATVQWFVGAGATLVLTPSIAGPLPAGTTQALQATLRSGAGNPVPNATIAFAVTGPNATSGTGVTDAGGAVTFSYSGGTDGTDAVVASLTVGSYQLRSAASHVQWFQLPGSVLVLAPSSAGPNPTGTTQTMTATLTSGLGNPVANATVTFTITGPNAGGGTAVTNALGVATFHYTALVDGTDSVQAAFQATPTSSTLHSGTSSIEWIQISGAGLTLSTPPLSPTGTPLTLQATLTSGGSGQPVANAPIHFAVTGANTASGTATTNAGGVATFTYTGTVEGLDTITATFTSSSNQTLTATQTARWFKLAGASITLSPVSTGPLLAPGSQAITATFLSGSGAAVPGATLTATVSGANPAVLTATTNASGAATFTVNGSNGGSDSVVATYASGSTTVTSNTAKIAWMVMSGASITIASLPAQPAGGVATVQATLRSGGDMQPVAGATLTFTVTGANPQTQTATTNAFGVATFSYTGTNTGIDTIVATYTLGGTTVTSNQVTQQWYNLATSRLTVSPAVAGPNALGTSQGVQATLVDGNGNPIAGAALTVNVAGPNVTSASLTTDGSGVALFTFTGHAGGTDTVTAVVSSGSQTLTSNPATISWLQAAGATLVLGDAGPGIVGAPLTLTAQLLSGDDGKPVANAPITFAVSGANPTGGTSTSDLTGTASFTYTGANAGLDNIQATSTAGGVTITSNTLTVGWIVPIQPVSTTTVAARFFGSDGSGAFDTPATATPVFTQKFPVIDFNPPGGVVPDNRSGVSVSSRPFTDVTTDVNGTYAGALPAQGNGYQAGVGPLGSFQAVFTANLEVAQAGDISFFFDADDGWILGVGGGATRVGGATRNPPASGRTAFQGYPVMGDDNGPESPTYTTVTVHFPAAGIYPYEVDYSECCGGEEVLTMGTAASGHDMAATGTLAITPDNPPGAQVGTRATFTVAALDGGGKPIANVPVALTISGSNSGEVDGTTDASGLAVLTYTGMNAGSDHLQAAGRIDGMPAFSNTVTMPWSLVPVPGGGGTTAPAPAVSPPGPADGTVVTKPVPITASVTPPAGQTITSWSVTYQALDPEAPVTIASGTGAPPAPPTPLATFDPTLLANDTYAVTVYATASGGGTQSATTTLAVSGNLKLGRFTTTYQDLSVPVNGFQMQVRRSYDSYDKRTGDFGVGWRVSVGNFRTSANRQLGAGGWTEYPTSCIIGLCWWSFRTSTPHFVTVTWPDQHQEFFDFTPSGGAALFYFQGTSGFTARAGTGTTSTLQVDGGTAINYGFDGNIYDANYNLFNPTRFDLTTRDGRKLVLDVTTGLVSEADPSGNSLSVDGAGVHASNGESISFTRDTQGRITDILGPTSQHLVYTYSAAGDLATSQDPLGNITTYTYDSNHDLTGATGPGADHPLSTVTYDSSGRVSSVTDANGNAVQLSDSVGAQQQTTLDPAGRLTTVDTFDDRGDVVREDRVFDGRTLTTSATYDSVGRELTATNALGSTMTAVYDAMGDVTQLTDAMGHTWSATYDASGHMLTLTGPDGVTDASLTYDSVGRPTRVQHADGTADQYAYDTAGHLTTVTDPAGHVTQYSYDAAGHLASTTDRDGLGTQSHFDATGLLLSVTAPGGGTTSMTYDAIGDLLSQTDPANHVRTWSYNSRGDLVSATDALGHTNTVAYDPTDHVVSTTDRDGRVVAYGYDADGRTTSRTLPGNDVTTFTYDGLGRMLTAVNSTAQLAYAYDAAGRATSVTTSAGTATQLPTVTIARAYDNDGHVTSSSGPDGAIAYGHDARGRLTSITDPQNGSFQLAYDAVSRLNSFNRPNGVDDSFTYDSDGNLTSLVSRHGTTTVQSLAYTYDAGGRRLSRADSSSTLTYGYNSLGELTSVTPSSGTNSETYTYDALGNRLTSAGSAVSATYDAQNRITSNGATSYTFDREGHLVTQSDQPTTSTGYAWNAAGQLTSVTHSDQSTTSYRYDPFGNLVEENDRGAVTRWAWDGANQRLQYDGSNNLLAGWVTGAGAATPLEMTSGGQSSYYLRDGAENVVALTNAGGSTAATYTYDSFGRTLASTGTAANPMGFAGALHDAGSGMYSMHARFYDPTLGRFLSEDPVRHVNAYSYVKNDPANYFDPSGADAMGEYAMELSTDTVAEEEAAASLGEEVATELDEVETALEDVTPDSPAPGDGPCANLGGDEGTPIYRGVPKDHHAYTDALNGTARPGDPMGHADPVLHNEGFTYNSRLTSWTTDPAVASGFAKEGGVVLNTTLEEMQARGVNILTSPDAYNESEVLLEGTITDLGVTCV